MAFSPASVRRRRDRGVAGNQRAVVLSEHPDAALLARLSAELTATLDGVLAPGTRIALIGGALHANAGDHAILLGTLAYARARDLEIAYFAAEPGAFDQAAADRALGAEGVIVFGGGGNFNDLWPHHQRLRETIATDNRDRRLVQLPQSVFFGDEANAESAAAALAPHPSFAMLVRDRTSADRARKLGLEPRLCPDIALHLGPRARPADPVQDLLVLGRTDLEGTVRWPAELEAPGVMADWARARPGTGLPARLASRMQTMAGGSGRATLRAQERSAWRSLWRAERMLSAGRVVITDRIHGHILSVLLGIPNVILDNVDGKVSAFHQAWTNTSALTAVASDPAHAIGLAREMV